MNHPSEAPDPELLEHALVALHEACMALAAEGCGPAEVASALAGMLGVVIASVACCEEHAAGAEKAVLDIFRDSLGSNRLRFAAWERTGVIHEEGHA